MSTKSHILGRGTNVDLSPSLIFPTYKFVIDWFISLTLRKRVKMNFFWTSSWHSPYKHHKRNSKFSGENSKGKSMAYFNLNASFFWLEKDQNTVWLLMFFCIEDAQGTFSHFSLSNLPLRNLFYLRKNR